MTYEPVNPWKRFLDDYDRGSRFRQALDTGDVVAAEAILQETHQAVERRYPRLRELTVDQIKADAELSICVSALGMMDMFVKAVKRGGAGPPFEALKKVMDECLSEACEERKA